MLVQFRNVNVNDDLKYYRNTTLQMKQNDAVKHFTNNYSKNIQLIHVLCLFYFDHVKI